MGVANSVNSASVKRYVLAPWSARQYFCQVLDIAKEHLNLSLICCQQESAAFGPTAYCIDSAHVGTASLEPCAVHQQMRGPARQDRAYTLQSGNMKNARSACGEEPRLKEDCPSPQD